MSHFMPALNNIYLITKCLIQNAREKSRIERTGENQYATQF